MFGKGFDMGKNGKPSFLGNKKKTPLTRQVSRADVKRADAPTEATDDIANFILGVIPLTGLWYKLQIEVPPQESNDDYRYVMYVHPKADDEPNPEAAEWKQENDNVHYRYFAEHFPNQKFLCNGEEVTYFLEKNFPHPGFFRKNARVHLENKTILYNYTAVTLPRYVTFLDPTVGQSHFIEEQGDEGNTYNMVSQENEASSSNPALSRPALIEKLKTENFEKQIEELKRAQEQTFQLLVPVSNAPSSTAAQKHQQSLLDQLKKLQQQGKRFFDYLVQPGAGSFREVQTGAQLLETCIKSARDKIAEFEKIEAKTAKTFYLVDTIPKTVSTSKPIDKENTGQVVNASQIKKGKKSKKSRKTNQQIEAAHVSEEQSKKVINEAPWDGQLIIHYLDLPKVDYARYKFTKKLMSQAPDSSVAKPMVRYDIPDSGLAEWQKEHPGFAFKANQTKTIVYLMYDAIRNYDFTQGPMEITAGSKRDIEVAIMVVKALQLPQRYNKLPEELIVDKRPGVQDEKAPVKKLFKLLKEEKNYRVDKKIDPTSDKVISEERELYDNIKRDMHEYGMMKEVSEYKVLKLSHYSFFQISSGSEEAASSQSAATPEALPPHPEHK